GGTSRAAHRALHAQNPVAHAPLAGIWWSNPSAASRTRSSKTLLFPRLRRSTTARHRARDTGAGHGRTTFAGDCHGLRAQRAQNVRPRKTTTLRDCALVVGAVARGIRAQPFVREWLDGRTRRGTSVNAKLDLL